MICRTAAALIDRSLDVPLSIPERVGLAVHTLFCGPCRRFRRQLARLDAAWRAAADAPTGGAGLPPDARARIAAALGREVGGS
jgi:hypothetical protein